MIVPQLGGFIAQDVPARYVAEENIFLPPHRSVAFNPQLTLNDGLLVQSYMRVYDTNYPETIKLIDQDVSNLKSEIQEKGFYELNGIGKITTNVDGSYVFEPNEAGIIAPSLYGLDAVTVKRQEKKKNTAEVKRAVSEKDAPSTRNYTISINKELVNYVAAAVVSIFFYFIWATPLTDSSTINAQQASILFPHTIQHVQKEAPECIPCDSVSTALPTAVEQEAEEKVETEKEEVDSSTTAESQPSVDQPSFTIVLASRVPLKNAQLFAEKLNENGYKEVSVLQKRNITRVIHGHYSSEAEAYTDLHQLRAADSQFKEAWILKIR